MNLNDVFIRFLLNLNCREEDYKTIKKSIPEVLNNEYSSPNHIGYGYFPVSLNDFVEWVNRYKNLESEDESFSAKEKGPLLEEFNCHVDMCPYKAKSSNRTAESHMPEDSSKMKGPIQLDLMTVGGGNKRNHLNEFINLIQTSVKVTHTADNIQSLIFTDPYLAKSTSEDGQSHNGFDNLKRVIAEGFGIDESTCFKLYVSQSLNHVRENFESHLKKTFSGIDVRLYTGSQIHDRFYMAQNKGNTLKGVFGPSVNGLNANSVFLMGELERNVLDELQTLINYHG